MIIKIGMTFNQIKSILSSFFDEEQRCSYIGKNLDKSKSQGEWHRILLVA